VSVDVILGRVGTRLPSDTGVLLADADAASTIEQVRWSRAACVVTPAGRLVRAVDTGHEPQYLGFPLPMNVTVAGATCSVCGQAWPCASRTMELEAAGADVDVEGVEPAHTWDIIGRTRAERIGWGMMPAICRQCHDDWPRPDERRQAAAS